MLLHASETNLRRRVRFSLGVIPLLSLLSGCVANSSNPEIHALSAVMSNESATITLQLINPGGRDLTVQSLQYELSHGEMGFPLASDTWSGKLDLQARGEARLPLVIPFDDEPMEMDSSILYLNGILKFKDHTGFFGLSSMNLTSTSFQSEIEARRNDE